MDSDFQSYSQHHLTSKALDLIKFETGALGTMEKYQP